MTYEKGPAEEYTRDDPMVIWTADHTKLELFTVAAGVSSAGDAMPSNAGWVIRVGGADHRGWEASVTETERDVQAKALEWWEQKRGRPDA